MQDYQREFLQLALEHGALKLGEFTLKSGRSSPYFFNLGRINGGAALTRLGHLYARRLMDADIEYDMLFGPAYKGIALAAAVATALAEQGRDVAFAYDRKEAKTHGEQGQVVGDLEGRVVIVDDVITAGTAIGNSVQLIRSVDARPVAVLIALDRQERTAAGENPAISAVQAVRQQHGLEVLSICGVAELIEFLAEQGETAAAGAVRDYQAEFGA